jgi:hypothetical protein
MTFAPILTTISPMNTNEYLAALSKLGLPPYGKATCSLLGMSPRAIARMATGGTVTQTVALLLRMYLRFGLIHPLRP